ncbi:hypothetical protein D3C87_1704810 [compost metagenome]
MSGVGWMWGLPANWASSAASRWGWTRVMSTMYTASRSALRASKLRLKTCRWAISVSASPRIWVAAARRGASGASATVKGSRISESRIMFLRARVDRAGCNGVGPR